MNILRRHTIDWHEVAFRTDKEHRKETVQQILTYVVPRDKKDYVYDLVDDYLESKEATEGIRERHKGEKGDEQEKKKEEL